MIDTHHTSDASPRAVSRIEEKYNPTGLPGLGPLDIRE